MPAPSDSSSARRIKVSMSLNSARVGRRTRQLVRLIFSFLPERALLLQPEVRAGNSSGARVRTLRICTVRRHNYCEILGLSRLLLATGAPRRFRRNDLAACKTLAVTKTRVGGLQHDSKSTAERFKRPKTAHKVFSKAKAQSIGARGEGAPLGSAGVARRRAGTDAEAGDQGERTPAPRAPANAFKIHMTHRPWRSRPAPQ